MKYALMGVNDWLKQFEVYELAKTNAELEHFLSGLELLHYRAKLLNLIWNCHIKAYPRPAGEKVAQA
jgi:hypothetical protein